MLGRDVGADDINAGEARLGFDRRGAAPPGKIAVVDLEVEVLGHLAAVDHRPDRQTDLGGAAQARALAADLKGDAGELALGRDQELPALTGPLRRPLAI